VLDVLDAAAARAAVPAAAFDAVVVINLLPLAPAAATEGALAAAARALKLGGALVGGRQRDHLVEDRSGLGFSHDAHLSFSLKPISRANGRC
jgi:hypothetical protein